MKLKLKRSTRTPYSEEILVYDFDNLDAEENPAQIGKLDVHYIEDQIVGTLLISQEFAEGYGRAHGGGSRGQAALDDLISEVIAEVSEPVGVSGTYAVEVYYAPFSSQGFFSNYVGDEAGEAENLEGEYARSDYDAASDYQIDEHDSALTPPTVPPGPSIVSPLDPHREEDDFSRRLRER